MRLCLLFAVFVCALSQTLAAPSTKRDAGLQLQEQMENFQSRMFSLNDQLKTVLKTIKKEKSLGNSNTLDKRGVEKSECIKKSIVQENDPFILRIALTIMKRINTKESRTYIEKLVNATADHVVVKMGADHGIKRFHKRLLTAVLQLLKVRSILTIKTEGQFLDKLDVRKPRTLGTTRMDYDQSKVVQALEELLEGPLIKGFVSKKEEEKMIKKAVEALGKAFELSKNRTESIARVMIEHVHEDVKEVKPSKEKGKPMTDDEKIKGLQKMVEDKVVENQLNIEEMRFLVKGLAAAVGARNKLSAEKTSELENRILKGVEDYFAKNKLPASKEKQSDHLNHLLKEFEKISGQYRDKFQPKDTDSNSLKKEKRGFGDFIQNAIASIRGMIKANGNQKPGTGNQNKNVFDQLKTLPAGFRQQAPTSSKDGVDKVQLEAGKNTRGSTSILEEHISKKDEVGTVKENSKRTLLNELKELEKLVANSNIPTVPKPSKDTGDILKVDAAKNTWGSTSLVEQHDRKREHSEAARNGSTEAAPTEGPSPLENLDKLLGDLQDLTMKVKGKFLSGQKKTRVVIHAAKGTMGERKIVEGFKRKRGLSEVIAGAIALIKSLKAKEEKSRKYNDVEKPTTPLPTAVPTTIAKMVPTTKSTLKPVVEATNVTSSEETGKKAKKSEISDAIEAEIEKAEAEIQKELEEQIKEEERKRKQADKEKPEKGQEEEKEEQKEEEEKEKQEQKEEEKEEKKEQKEEQEKEHQEQKEEEEKEKQEQKEEEKEEKKKQKEEEEKEKHKQNEETQKQKLKQGNKGQNKSHQRNNTKVSNSKKSDIPSTMETQIEADEKKIEKELEAQTNDKNNLFDKLQSLQNQKEKEGRKETDKEDSNELIKELDELFATN